MKKVYVLAITVCSICLANAQVIDLNNPNAQVMDISNNGIAVGNVSGAEHFMFSTEMGGLIIGETSQNGVVGNESISADGTKITASVIDTEGIENAGIYNVQSQEWTFFTGFGKVTDGGQSSSWGMSSDGQHVVGFAYTPTGSTVHGTIWNNDNPIPVDLGSSITNRNSRANDVNGDGTVVVGYQADSTGYLKAAMWKNGVQTLLKDNDGVTLGEAQGVTADGKTVIGVTADGNGYIWNETNGTIIYQNPNSDYITYMTRISDDGSVALGFSFDPMDSPLFGQGIIWTATNGFEKLDDYIANLGYDNEGISFVMPTAISPDGKYLGGIGVNWDEMDTAGFLIKLPALATSDIKTSEKLSVYPNPAEDVLNIKTGDKIENVEVYSVTGQKIIASKVTNNTLNVSQLGKGAYILKVNTSKGAQTTKFIKK